jgi:hypothetical protein
VVVVLISGVVQAIELRKRRWRQVGTNTTCHSRPPGEIAWMRYSALLMVIRLWAWISSAEGVHRHEDESASKTRAGSLRSMQRWSRRAVGNALMVQQAIRQATLATREFEPRPEDDLFRGARGPPDGLVSKHWQYPTATTTLWRAFDMLFVAAKQQSTQAALLLAETRRRWHAQDDIFPI